MTIRSIDLRGRGALEAARYWRNLSVPELYEHAVRRDEALIVDNGPLLADTGEHTGRSPQDKFLVREPSTAAEVWWGDSNRPIDEAVFAGLLEKVRRYVAGRELYVFDGYACADPAYRLPLRVVSERAWHSLFAHNMFLREPDRGRLDGFVPDAHVVDLPGLLADPAVDGTRSPTFILVHLAERLVLIGGTEYAGEIKKSIFGLLKYVLPRQGVLSMHCSANYGADRDDVALFFGLSGTGKTTLSADPSRTLIGDDEHGWSDCGVFNFEGGCYAKVIRLRRETEPEIFATTHRFGTVLENVVYHPGTRQLDLDDDSKTENTRSCYPLTYLEHVDLGGVAGHPRCILFLTCDAFGVLPPIARLDEAQAMYHFLSGYTAKVAGTERGVTEPQATFSTCFAAPFMPLHPPVYARMLGDKIRKHGARVWLVNTGWTGGPPGEGQRIPLPLTRRMVEAALGGEIDAALMRRDPVFGLEVPRAVEGVPPEILEPRSTWRDGHAYDRSAAKLADMFVENFQQFAEEAGPEIAAAGPR
ncbi:MAG TPA: phosphoenolpyruvate carboxykinase (ATP), partial [Thermoanaerobaculia bacterium]|nr:phosphoenolpyruvate carboxykinase (ATP) [Thermoanaerobaculia bacterium]